MTTLIDLEYPKDLEYFSFNTILDGEEFTIEGRQITLDSGEIIYSFDLLEKDGTPIQLGMALRSNARYSFRQKNIKAPKGILFCYEMSGGDLRLMYETVQ